MIKEGSLEAVLPRLGLFSFAEGMSSDRWGEGQAGARVPDKNKHGIYRTSRE